MVAIWSNRTSLLGMTLLAASSAWAQTSAPAASQPAASPPRVWTALSAQKIFRDDLPPVATTHVTLHFAAARGEAESAQLVLRGERPSTLTLLELGSIASHAGDTLPREWFDIFRVVYIHLPATGKDYPDPLPPLQLPLELPAATTQPLWLRVTLPPGAKSGCYRGEVKLTFADGGRVSVPLQVTVWPFDVPRKPTMRTAFGMNPGEIAKRHNVKPGTPEGRDLIARYWECLIAHRISPYEIPVSLFDADAGKYLGDERLTSFVIPYSDDDAQLHKTVDHLRANGWLDKGYFYVVDEPKTKEQYERLQQVCRKIQAVDPKLKIVSPYFCDAEFDKTKTPYDLLAGYINIWCPNSNYFKPEPMAARQKAGEEAWWYVCCGPGAPYANFFIEMDGLSHRMLMWQQKQQDVQGLLYWSSTWWSGTSDPWEDMATVKDINPKIYGDGSLLYPGSKVGVDGPVTSIRLEIIRDGLEDYEYLTQYERRFGRENTQALIGRLVRNMTDFERDPYALDLVRAELAGALAR